MTRLDDVAKEMQSIPITSLLASMVTLGAGLAIVRSYPGRILIVYPTGTITIRRDRP